MSLRTTHVLAIVGAVTVFVATAVTWYTHDVSVVTQAGQVAYSSSKSYTLWDLTTLAPVLIVIAAALGAILLLFAPLSSSRIVASVAGLCGLDGVLRRQVLQLSGSRTNRSGDHRATTGGVDANASTVLGAGPFVGIVGGLLLAASAFGLAGERPERA